MPKTKPINAHYKKVSMKVFPIKVFRLKKNYDRHSTTELINLQRPEATGLEEFAGFVDRRINSRTFPVKNKKCSDVYRLVYFNGGQVLSNGRSYTKLDIILRTIQKSPFRLATFRELLAFGTNFRLILTIIMNKDFLVVFALNPLSKKLAGRRFVPFIEFGQSPTPAHKLELMEFSKDLNMTNDSVYFLVVPKKKISTVP